MLTIDILTIFPGMFEAVVNESILKRAQNKKKVRIRVHDLRKYTHDKHRKVDDRPFGGGPGMVLMPQPIFDAVRKIKGRRRVHVILTCAGGRTLSHRMTRRISRHKNILIICGHYEGVDERVRRQMADESVSIGDYVLTGGELPAMVLVDAVVRQIPGVLGKEESLADESFTSGLLEYPQYTRPANFRGHKVPPVLLSGHHDAIRRWRQQEALRRTKKHRPDLLGT